MTCDGYNPIKWDCLDRGCFNRHRHYNIEELAQCFPSKIGLTDIDGFVELNGHFLFVEFKQAAADIGGGAPIPLGQKRAFEALTGLSDRITVIVDRCNYITSEITEFNLIKSGRSRNWIITDLAGFRTRLLDWSRRVAPERMSA